MSRRPPPGISGRGMRAFLGAAAGLVALASCGAAHAQPSASTRPAMTVSVVKAANACFKDQLQATGTVVAREEVLVRPETEGFRIAEILVEDGDRVEANASLARLTRAGGSGNAENVTVKAPAAGIVVQGTTPIGMMASSRADPLFRIIVGGEVDLRAEVPIPHLRRLTPGQGALVSFPGLGEVSGRVRTIEPEVDFKYQLGRIRVSLTSDPRLRVGAFGRATIEIGQSCNPSVPMSALLYGQDSVLVQIVRNNRIEIRRVRLGLQAGDRSEILDGVGGGELVVARAGSFLREGDLVRAVEEPAAEPR